MSDEDLAVDQKETSTETEEKESVEEDEVSGTEELSEEEQAQAKLKEAIHVEREDLGSLRMKITITVPWEALNERRNSQFAELKRDALVPGFRKGHAPLRLVEKRFGSEVGEQLKAQLVSSGYLAAIEKEEIKALGNPLFQVKVEEERVGKDSVSRRINVEKLLPLDDALDHIVFPTEGPLTFSCEVELKPEFELPELTKIPVERPKVAIDDDDVEAEIKRLCMWRGTFQPVEEGSIEASDLLYADMRMSVDGDLILSEENVDLAARALHVKGVPLEAFGEAVIGKKHGDTVTVEAPVPDDHENVDIRGKTARFEFVIREIKRFVTPPLDDELLSSLGYESAESLRSDVRGRLESQLEFTIKEAMCRQIGEYLIDHTEMDIPEGLSQRQTDRSLHRRRIEMYQAGVPEAEVEEELDEMRAGARDDALRSVKLFFILSKIAEERDIDVSEEEINGAIAQIAQRSHKRFDRVRDELSKGDGLMMLYQRLRDQKLLDSLLADAAVRETEGPKKKKTAAKAKKKTTGTKAGKSTTTATKAEKKTTAGQVKKQATAKKKTVKKKSGKRSS